MPTFGLRQCRRIVDAVAGHRDASTLALQALDNRGFLIRKNVRLDVLDSQRLGNGVGCDSVVAGQHDDVDAFTSASLSRPRSAVSLIGSATDTRPAAFLSIATIITVCPPCSKCISALSQRPEVDAEILHLLYVADRH